MRWRESKGGEREIEGERESEREREIKVGKCYQAHYAKVKLDISD